MSEEQAAPEVTTPTGTAPEGEVTTQKPQAEQQAQEATQKQDGEKLADDGEDKHRSRAYRRLDRWRQRAIEAETRLKLTQEQGQPRQEQRPEARTDEGPKREQFDSYEDFIKAEARHEARKEAQETARKTLEESRRAETEAKTRAAQEKELRAWNAKVEAARDEIEDFDEVCAESDATVTPAMADAIKESDKSAHLAYYLAKNPAEADRISKLSPSKQAAAIVALEEKVGKPAKAPSKAPAPINPGSGKAEAASDVPSDKDDMETWMRKERARMEKAGVRL